MAESQKASKPLSFFQKHRFFLFYFLFLLSYHYLIVNRLEFWRLTDLTYSLYCVDFSFGFASKLLPGAIFRALFGSNANEITATFYATVVIILIFAGISAILERFMLRMSDAHKPSALLLVTIFLTGAYTFSIFTKWLGILDTSWLVLIILFFAFLDHKQLRFLIPLVYAGAIMIHFSALVFFITIFSIILLYRISVSQDKKEKKIYGAILSFSLVITVIFFFILIINESHTVVPIEQFHEKLRNNGTTYYNYFDYAFFRMVKDEYFIPDYVNEMKPFILKFINLFYYQVKVSFELLNDDVEHGIITSVIGAVVLLPILRWFITFHFKALREKGNTLRRFCALLMLLQMPFVFVLALLFAISVDMTRYYSYLFLGAFMCFLVVLYYEEDKRAEFFEMFESRKNSLGFKIYLLSYFMFTLMPC